MIEALPPLAASQSLTVIGKQAQEQQKQRGNDSNRSFNSASKPTTAFMSQLLASRHAAPAYRQKRRASPAEARSAYLAMHAISTVSAVIRTEPAINFQA